MSLKASTLRSRFLSVRILLTAALAVTVGFMFCSDCDVSLFFFSKFGAAPSQLLKGRVVWITGASSGIGEALAYELASCGCKVILSARREHELERVRKKCIEIAEANCMACNRTEDFFVLPLNLKQFDTHNNLTHEVLRKYQKIDILVNNGGFMMFSEVWKTNWEVDLEIINTNLLGTISLTKAVLPHMLRQRRGHVAVVTSLAGKFAFGTTLPYTAAKHGLQGYFDGLRSEVKNLGVDVTIIVPGPVVSSVVQNAYTGTLDKRFQGPTLGEMIGVNEMTAEHCAQLFAVALAQRLEEAWISVGAFLWQLYLVRPFPWLVNRIKIPKEFWNFYNPPDRGMLPNNRMISGDVSGPYVGKL